MDKQVSIMPCLDMQNGRVVKGVHFVDIHDAGDPVECALAYCKAGADELALLDITATIENRPTMLEVVKNVASSLVTLIHRQNRLVTVCFSSRKILMKRNPNENLK